MKQNLPTHFDQADITNISHAFHYPPSIRPVHPTHKLENSLWSFRFRLSFARRSDAEAEIRDERRSLSVLQFCNQAGEVS